MTATHYEAFVQMPVKLYEDVIEIVEAEITLPIWYQPAAGHQLITELVKGALPLSAVFFDCARDTIVLISAAAAFNATQTLDEWLTDNPKWVRPKLPLFTLEKPNDKQG